MDLANKKLMRSKNEIRPNEAAAFLSYCAYDVRWSMIGNAYSKSKAAEPTFVETGKGESDREKNPGQTIGESKVLIRK